MSGQLVMFAALVALPIAGVIFGRRYARASQYVDTVTRDGLAAIDVDRNASRRRVWIEGSSSFTDDGDGYIREWDTHTFQFIGSRRAVAGRPS